MQNRINPITGKFNMVNCIKDLVQLIYPVGHILMTENSANPATYLGIGTWVSYGAGRVPVGIDTTQTEFNTLAKTGGEKAHSLSVGELAQHNHSLTLEAASYGTARSTARWYSGEGVNYGGVSATTSNSGSGAAHNNLQPYIVCYMWKRTV